MINNLELQRQMNELHSKHFNFFESSNTSVINYININDDEITFKPGIILNMETWEDFKYVLGIKDSPCEETYPKNTPNLAQL